MVKNAFLVFCSVVPGFLFQRSTFRVFCSGVLGFLFRGSGFSAPEFRVFCSDVPVFLFQLSTFRRSTFRVLVLPESSLSTAVRVLNHNSVPGAKVMQLVYSIVSLFTGIVLLTYSNACKNSIGSVFLKTSRAFKHPSQSILATAVINDFRIQGFQRACILLLQEETAI